MFWGSQGTRDITPSQACVQTRGAPHHCPWLVSLSLATTAGICFASPHRCAWTVPDLPSSVVWESGTPKASICRDTAARPVCSGSTTSAQSWGINRNLSEGCSILPCHQHRLCVTSVLPLILCARSLHTSCTKKGDSLLQGLMVACNLP